MNEHPIFNYDTALNRLDGDKDLFKELVEMLFAEYDGWIVDLREAVKARDPKHIEERAHSMKGALGNVGAERAWANAAALEKAGKASQFDTIDSLLATLEENVGAFRDEVGKVLGA